MIAQSWISERFRADLEKLGLDTVEGALAFTGGEDLDKPGLGHRRRTRIELTDATGRAGCVYLKRYAGGRRGPTNRVSPAGAELANIRAARAAGIATMEPVAFGQDGPSGLGRSYLVVSEVPGDALERCGESFLKRRGPESEAARELTEKLASLARTLHGAGFVHRDFYASHVFLDETKGGEIELYLIDLARMFAPRWRRFRWRVKDLAQLKYSMPDEWVGRWWKRFMSAYLAGESRSTDKWERAIDAKVASMRKRAGRRGRN